MMMRLHPMPITGVVIPELAWESAHVIREAFEIGCLASPFVLSSEWLAAPA